MKIPTDGGSSLSHNPFASLNLEGLPPGPAETAAPGPVTPGAKPKKSRGRVDIIRQTAHRGGKTVTVVSGFVGIGLPEKEALAKAMQRAIRDSPGAAGHLAVGQRRERQRLLLDCGWTTRHRAAELAA